MGYVVAQIVREDMQEISTGTYFPVTSRPLPRPFFSQQLMLPNSCLSSHGKFCVHWTRPQCLVVQRNTRVNSAVMLYFRHNQHFDLSTVGSIDCSLCGQASANPGKAFEASTKVSPQRWTSRHNTQMPMTSLLHGRTHTCGCNSNPSLTAQLVGLTYKSYPQQPDSRAQPWMSASFSLLPSILLSSLHWFCFFCFSGETYYSSPTKSPSQ